MRFEKFETVVIGGEQAGLAVGYYLARQKRDFVILDANARVGDSWRKRWDSLRLFTPASLDQLPGMPFPAARGYFPLNRIFWRAALPTLITLSRVRLLLYAPPRRLE